MNKLQLTLLPSLLLLLVGDGLLLSASAVAEPEQHQHAQANALSSLSLNEGAKWPVDEVLSAAMLHLRQQLVSRLDAIHNNRFSQQEYQQFAQLLGQEIDNIVSNCQLTPGADAQFHLLLATLIQAKTAMQHHTISEQRQGAVQMLKALQHYPMYFQDNVFTPIEH